ncbi:SDR family oxidoreductase [Paenibacillus sp. GCM10012307]|uniref:SDR family oxidoreductase n=1 Tax=Paenibacillus roseus TaxID=2798579 RepID=A0A934J7U7_9BACL|nr:SDR family oxidoreductase [Paenibacillus roseus]MBJ6361970.1 SDR family oxidoreductase [Paenibacillus roseus]
MLLKDKRVVIIGGSAGIGFAAAQAAVVQGASVIIAGRSAEKLEKAKAIIGSDKVEAIQLDNRVEEEIKLFFEKVGPFDHLFTPGASYVLGPITSDSDIAKSSFEGKFWPQYFAVKYASPYLSKSGSIVLMSGAFSQRPLNGGASYAACNGAIESLGKALAVELSPIRVNVVSPGTIRTAREGAAQEKRKRDYEAYKEMCALGRVGQPEEIAHSVLYLWTNTYTTGSTLFPDGGYIFS